MTEALRDAAWCGRAAIDQYRECAVAFCEGETGRTNLTEARRELLLNLIRLQKTVEEFLDDGSDDR